MYLQNREFLVEFHCNVHLVLVFLFSCSLYLFRQGLAPQIHDLCGKVKFTGRSLHFHYITFWVF